MPLLCTGMLYSQVNKESSYQLDQCTNTPIEADSFTWIKSWISRKETLLTVKLQLYQVKLIQELDIDISWEVKLKPMINQEN